MSGLMRMIWNKVGQARGAFAYDADAQAFFDAAIITNGLQKEAVSDLVVALKAAGIWPRMVAIYPMVGGSAFSHKWNLKNPLDTDAAKRLAFVGGWTHSASGALPNGTNAYAKTFINPNDDMPAYSFHGSYYSRTIGNSGPGDYVLFGGRFTGAGIALDLYSTNRYYCTTGHVNSSASNVIITVLNQNTFSRLMGTSCYHENQWAIYRDGNLMGSTNTVRFNYFVNQDPNSSAGRLYLAAENANEAAVSFTPRECAFASFGYGLNPTEWAALNTAVNNFQTALNRNV